MKYFRVFNIAWPFMANDNCPAVVYIQKPETVPDNEVVDYARRQLTTLMGYRPIGFGAETVSEQVYDARQDDDFEL